jgi:ParB-like chromosome segregation protein Spo0J
MGRKRAATHTAEFDHGQILELPPSELRPARLNNVLYRPVDPRDPDIIALAASIREHGLREPLVVTLDRVILSGHRRHAACRLAGLTAVLCRVEPIASTDPSFLILLREFNRQRVKTFEEVAREEVLSVDPEDAHRLLVEHRRRRGEVSRDTIVIEGVKRRSRISAAKEPFLRAVLAVLEEHREFWPLTDRMIHYALLNDPPLIHASKPESAYRNDHASYRATIDLLTRARLAGRIAWAAIHDPTRPVNVWTVWQNVGPFIRSELDGFLKGYYRDLQQSQPNHIEIVGEKNTVAGIIEPVAQDYRIPFSLGRGYSSLPLRFDLVRRYRRSGKERLVLLLLGDFDPEGEDIGHSLARSLRDDFGVWKLDPIKVALTEEQVEELGLPPQMQAKESSSRYEKFADQHGTDVFELEAVPPAQAQEILREAIDDVLDQEAFDREIEQEKQDAARLEGLRRTMQRALGNVSLDEPGGETRP